MHWAPRTKWEHAVSVAVAHNRGTHRSQLVDPMRAPIRYLYDFMMLQGKGKPNVWRVGENVSKTSALKLPAVVGAAVVVCACLRPAARLMANWPTRLPARSRVRWPEHRDDPLSDQIDAASEASFPASDPPSFTSIVGAGAPRR